MRVNKLIWLAALSSPLAHSQTAKVDMFPERSVKPDRSQISVTIDNPSNFDIKCDYVNNYVIYRSSTSENNIEEMLPLKNIAIPAGLSRTFVTGAERTAALRGSGLYPDAYIDVAKNDFLSSATSCVYAPIEGAEKSSILKAEASLENLQKLMQGPSARISNGSHYPMVVTIRVENETLVLEGYQNRPAATGDETKWDMKFYQNGTTLVRFTTAANFNNAVLETYAVGDPYLKNYLKYLFEILPSFEEVMPPPSRGRDIRDTLLGLLKSIEKRNGFDQTTIRLTLNGLNLTAPWEIEDGKKPVLTAPGQTPSQNWTYKGGALISNEGRCLAVKGDEQFKNGGQIFMWTCNGSESQKWTLDGNRIKTQNGFCLDVPSGDPFQGVQIWSCNENSWQTWSVRPL